MWADHSTYPDGLILNLLVILLVNDAIIHSSSAIISSLLIDSIWVEAEAESLE